MLSVMDIQKVCKNYIQRSFVLVVGLCAMGIGVMLTSSLPLATPLLVSALFVLTLDVAAALLFSWVAVKHADMLPSFFTGVSGFRFLLALVVLAVWYIASDSKSMRIFFVVFLVFYMVTLVHQTIFFSRESNRL